MVNMHLPSALSRRFALKAAFAAGALGALGVAATAAFAAGGQDVTGQVVLMKDGEPQRDRSNVVVYLKGVPNALPDTSKLVHHVYQRDKQFKPAVSVALVGSSIEFPNQDNVFHNVFSLSRILRFDLGLYKSGASKSVKAKRPGVIDVYCNIHPQMAAKILVLDTRYYAVTEADGKFKISGLPPGAYELVAWHPRATEFRQGIRVSAGSKFEARVQLVERGGRERHLRKDGTPYGRYE